MAQADGKSSGDQPRRAAKGEYGAGRLMARVISFSGWLQIGLSVLGALFTVASAFSPNQTQILPGYSNLLLASAGLVFGLVYGMFFVAVGQMMRATMDSANSLKQMLRIMQQ